MSKEATDVYGKALHSHAKGEIDPLILNTSYGLVEEMPLWYLFREYEDMPEMEKMAIAICEGHVLDVGAGTGSHSLILQQMGHSVTAIDTSSKAVGIMRESGVKTAQNLDFFDVQNAQFDTILLLMNGIGIVGQLQRMRDFLNHAKSLLREGGQLIFDSSDIRYLYENEPLPTDRYFGEVSFQYEFQGEKGEWFDWVYIDPQTLEEIAEESGWYLYFLHRDENDQYLVRMIPK